MACEAVRTWSLNGLVAAFVDLAIAYLLLCASTVAYFASKFLGVIGLRLPCPCDGFFFNIQIKSFCLNRLLVEFPGQIVSHVLLCVKDNFPFHDSIRRNCNYGAVDEICVNGIVEVEGEACCSSFSDARKPADVIRIGELSARAEKYDLKGKGAVGHRPRSRLRQRRKGVGGVGKNLGEPCSHSRGNMAADGLVGGVLLMGDNDAEGHYLEYNDKASMTVGMMGRAVRGVEMNPSHDEDINLRRLSTEELQNDQQEVQTFNGDEKNAIRVLEQRLEEERIARAALYVELEKERNAAASAADEAMAMILRLQEEKAAIEMESRQYQRILEEKSVYDAEEMTILKEILIRREKEKLFLEKEVEAYRQMVSFGDEHIANGGSDPNDGPILIPHKLTEKIKAENKFSDGVVSMEKPASKLAFMNESSLFKKRDLDGQSVQIPICSNAGNMDLQEKQVISVDKDLQLTSKFPQDCVGGARFGGEELELQTKHAYLGFSNSCYSAMDKDSPVHDVHIDGINLCSKTNADISRQFLVNGSLEVHEGNSATFEAAEGARNDLITDLPSSSGMESQFEVKKLNLEITSGFPPIGPRGLSMLSEQRQSSITPGDHEMVKINSEVGWLQERLKLVHEGREKLSLSGENQERGNIQLKLLEDIARQVQEIRHVTVTGKAARQVSLPLPTSKATSKKRRSRSVSSGFQISSEGEPL